MKICPTCRRTYSDDALNFCLDDGTVLTVSSGEPPETVLARQPLPTNPNAGVSPPPTMQTSWDRQPNYSMQPQKSSKTWLWVVGVLGLGLLLCGGGLVGFIILAAIGSQEENSNIVSSNSNTAANTAPDPRKDVSRIDLSEWVRPNSPFGTTEFTNGEFLMASRQKRFYYVLVAPEDYKTEAARTSVTLRNIDNADSAFGYGLIFLSNPKPLTQGYAFLIDSKKRKYRVVRHEPEKELVVVNWTNSSAIKTGVQENLLEADHKNDLIDLYINGQKVTSIRNVYGYQGGVAGLYAGDAAKIAFKNLEIRR
jgi:hypothetical protein